MPSAADAATVDLGARLRQHLGDGLAGAEVVVHEEDAQALQTAVVLGVLGHRPAGHGGRRAGSAADALHGHERAA